MTNGEVSSHVQSRPMSFLMLPNDLVLNCLGRISRLHYRRLSFVSKRFGSLLASRELYETRSSLGRTESCLYVSLAISATFSRTLRGFTLCQKPNSSRKILVPISSPNSPFDRMGVASIDSSIYAIGGKVNDNATSRVLVMDCHSHTWREAPSMQVARVLPAVCVLDGKIYVTGGCKNIDSKNWMEVFDTKTQTWEFLQIPSEEICVGSEYRTAAYEGTIYVSGEKNTWKLHRGKWRAADLALEGVMRSASYCVIDNVLYSCFSWKIHWYDSNHRIWRRLKGLPESFMSISSHRNMSEVRLADYGGKMAVLWDEYKTLNSHTKKIIWCAEIKLERKQETEIWGTVKWCDVMLITNQYNRIMHALATTV